MIFLWRLVLSTPVYAQAYCALRNPNEAMLTGFPEQTHHHSIVESITRPHITEVLDDADITLHRDEFGQHTLYQIYKHDELLGYIHVRTEPAQWGLMEVAWFISPEITVMGFYIQRCRDPLCQTLDTGPFADSLLGLTGMELIERIREYDSERTGDLEFLQRSVLKSGAKALLLTPVVWGLDEE